MKRNSKLVHWIAAFAILMSALAPTISQAVSIAKDQHGFVMEVCSAQGHQFSVAIPSPEKTNKPLFKINHCPYCLTHNFITPAFNTSLTLKAPQSFALLPKLFYQSPKLINVWVTPPSAAPPAQA